jgi:hypothetical protein
MTRSLHTGRSKSIQKARLEKRSRRMKSELADKDFGQIIGHREVGLIFTPVPSGAEDLHQYIQEILNVRNHKQYFNYRIWDDGKIIRRSKKEIRELFYCSLRRYEIIIQQEDYNCISDKAKSLLDKEVDLFKPSLYNRVYRKITYILPKKYYSWVESVKMQNVRASRATVGDAVRLHHQIWDEGENHRLDTHHKRDEWYTNPYIRNNRKVVIDEYLEYIKEKNERYEK